MQTMSRLNPSEEVTPYGSEIDEIDTRAERICRLMQKAAQHWMEVAREVHDAKTALSKDAFPIFLEKAQLTPSIANKLLTIAKTDILYEEQSRPYLQKLEGWTTLYEVAKLPESNIKDLYIEVDRDPSQMITRSFVQKFKSRNPRSALTPFAVIAIDETHIQRLDPAELRSVRDKLDEMLRFIDQSSPLFKMKVSDKVFERLEADSLVNALEDDCDLLVESTSATH